jgi:hypothetical protein
MSALDFMSPDGAAPSVRLVSPLARGAGVRDVSSLGKLEVRGDLTGIAPAPGEELIRITPGRALLVVDGPTSEARERLRAAGLRVYDLTAGLAALEVEGERLMRRLTELDLEALPAAGAVARGTPALIQRRNGEIFRLFVPQELAHFVAEFVLDQQQGRA